MKPELQRIAIHEALGWQKVTQGSLHYAWKRGDEFHYVAFTPDYLNSLDAMHEAEKVLLSKEGNDPVYDFPWGFRYAVELSKLGLAGEVAKLHATAAQRAEAFLRTLNLWQE